MLLLNRIWSFLRKYWKWILFPVGVLSLIATVLSSRSALPIGVDENILIGIENDKNAKLKEAAAERDVKLKQLAEEHKERLDTLSEQQEEELQSLTEKPIEEVVAWFDKL